MILTSRKGETVRTLCWNQTQSWPLTRSWVCILASPQSKSTSIGTLNWPVKFFTAKLISCLDTMPNCRNRDCLRIKIRVRLTVLRQLKIMQSPCVGCKPTHNKTAFWWRMGRWLAKIPFWEPKKTKNSRLQSGIWTTTKSLSFSSDHPFQNSSASPYQQIKTVCVSWARISREENWFWSMRSKRWSPIKKLSWLPDN